MMDGGIESKEQIEDDWRLAIMSQVNGWIQESESRFVPVVTSRNRDESSGKYGVRPLSPIIGVEPADLPMIYVYHPMTE